VAIIRGDKVIIPRGSTILQEGDNIIAVTKTEKEEQLRQILLG
jgi:Trk K+ transport system NAD-binding subunit